MLIDLVGAGQERDGWFALDLKGAGAGVSLVPVGAVCLHPHQFNKVIHADLRPRQGRDAEPRRANRHFFLHQGTSRADRQQLPPPAALREVRVFDARGPQSGGADCSVAGPAQAASPQGTNSVLQAGGGESGGLVLRSVRPGVLKPAEDQNRKAVNLRKAGLLRSAVIVK